MKETIEYLLKMVVSYPEQLIVNRITKDNLTILEIIVDPADMGKIIGKQGKVIKAIRTIVNAATIRDKNRTVVEIREGKKRSSSLPIINL